jgi:hypothetical protein
MSRKVAKRGPACGERRRAAEKGTSSAKDQRRLPARALQLRSAATHLREPHALDEEMPYPFEIADVILKANELLKLYRHGVRHDAVQDPDRPRDQLESQRVDASGAEVSAKAPLRASLFRLIVAGCPPRWLGLPPTPRAVLACGRAQQGGVVAKRYWHELRLSGDADAAFVHACHASLVLAVPVDNRSWRGGFVCRLQ